VSREDISRREVLLTLGGVAAAVGAGAATWGGLELLVHQKQTVDSGQAHPTSVQRTPGSSDYARLMEAFK